MSKINIQINIEKFVHIDPIMITNMDNYDGNLQIKKEDKKCYMRLSCEITGTDDNWCEINDVLFNELYKFNNEQLYNIAK